MDGEKLPDTTNVFWGEDGLRHYFSPKCHPPTSIVQLSDRFTRSVSSFSEEDGVQLGLKMMSELPLNTGKLVPVHHWFELQERQGKINENTVAAIASSGGAALPFTVLARQVFGIQRVIVFIPADAPILKKLILQAAGAELIETKEIEKANGAALARAMAKASPDNLVFGQYDDESNPNSHYDLTARQIHEQMESVGVRISGIATGIGTSGTYNGTTEYLSRHLPSAVAIGILCAENNPLPGMRPQSRLTEEQVPLFHKYKDGYRFEVKRYAGYEMTKKLFKEVGPKVGLTTGGVVQGTISFLEDLKANHPRQWDALKNPDGNRVFVCVSMDLLDLYLFQLGAILDAKDM